MLDTTTAPFVSGSASSEAAAQDIAPHVRSIRLRILHSIRDCPSGVVCTREHVIETTGLRSQTVAPRLTELIDDGAIRKSGRWRNPETDREHDVYELGCDRTREHYASPERATFSGSYGHAHTAAEHLVMALAMSAETDEERCDDGLFLRSGYPETRRSRIVMARGELVRKGLLIEAPRQTRTSSGRKASVWLVRSTLTTKEVREIEETMSNLRDYDRHSTYIVGQCIRHTAHGIGTVLSVDLDGTGITVSFPCGERELACGMMQAAA